MAKKCISALAICTARKNEEVRHARLKCDKGLKEKHTGSLKFHPMFMWYYRRICYELQTSERTEFQTIWRKTCDRLCCINNQVPMFCVCRWTHRITTSARCSALTHTLCTLLAAAEGTVGNNVPMNIRSVQVPKYSKQVLFKEAGDAFGLPVRACTQYVTNVTYV